MVDEQIFCYPESIGETPQKIGRQQMDTDSFSPITDKKKVKVGSNWFLFKFFANGKIEKSCWSFEQHQINLSFDTKENACQLCDFVQEGN